MSPAESTRLESYLKKLLGAPTLGVRSKGKHAELLVGAEKIADVTRDEEDGELSYYVNLGLPRAAGLTKTPPLDPAERLRLQAVLRETLGAPKLEVRARPRKTDSAEVYVADEFIGTLSTDDGREFGYFLTMSVLDIDLEGEG